MTGRRLAILGASGHGKVVADCAAVTGGWSEILFFDERYPELRECGPWKVAGGGAAFLVIAAHADVFVAIGTNTARLEWLGRLAEANALPAVVVHPRATVSAGAEIGAGTLVAPGAVVNIGARLGHGCIVNTGATVDHDCVLREAVHVSPGAHLAGNVTVGARSWIGIGAVTRHGISIGADVIVGAGAAVVTDVASGVTVVGVPARPLSASC